MNNDEQIHGSQQPNTTNEALPADVPDWLIAFMRSQQETNARLEQGIAHLQSTTINNTPSTSAGNPENDIAQPDALIAKKPKHSLTHPDKFTGDDESAFPQFKGLLEAKLEIDGQAIGTEKERVWYAFGRLTGKAAGRIYPWIDSSKHTNEFTVDGFMNQLDAAFADPQKQSKALAKINYIRQGKRDFREFLREFEQTLLEARGWKWEDSVRKGYLKAGLSRELKDRLVGKEEPALYSNYVAQLRRISDDLQDLKTWDSRQKHTPRSNTYIPRDIPPLPTETMDWEPTRTTTAATGRKPFNQPQSGQHAASSSQAERQRRRRNGACVRCNSMDHWVSDCPLLPPRPLRPQGAATSTQAKPRAPIRKPQISASIAPKSKTATVTAVDEVEEWETDEESGKE